MKLAHALVVLSLALVGCGVAPGTSPTSADELGVGSTGGVFATFQVVDERSAQLPRHAALKAERVHCARDRRASCGDVG